MKKTSKMSFVHHPVPLRAPLLHASGKENQAVETFSQSYKIRESSYQGSRLSGDSNEVVIRLRLG